MGAIQLMDGDGELERRRGGDLSRHNFSGIPGERTTYQERRYTMDESWGLLSPETRAWTIASAGEPLTDPFTGVERRHWYCDITLNGGSGPSGGPVAATALVVVFGRRGLAIAQGSCADFTPQPGCSRWRTARFDLPLDPSGVRHDHHPAAAPNLSMPQGRRSEVDGRTGAAPSAASLLDPQLAARFGNLPLATQRFLLHPFLSSGTRPQAPSDLQPTTELKAGSYTETYFCYLINARWVTFSVATRAVPYRSGLSGEALWNRSPEASAIARAPWQTQAWIAPKWRTAPPARELARRAP